MTIKKEAAPKKPTKKKVKKKAKKKVAKKKTPKKKNYLNNKDLLAEVVLSKANGKMSDKLAHMLTVLCARYGRKGNFSGYTYNDDMQAYAMMMLVRTWNSFKPEKSNNPFAFFTQCIKNSFIQFLNQERRQRDIRDVMLVDKGLTPSYTFQMEHETAQKKAAEEGHNEDGDYDDHNSDSTARPKELESSEDILKY